MHIGLTAEWLGTQAGGLETYTRELILALGPARPDLSLSAYTIRHDVLPERAGLRARHMRTGSRSVALGVAIPLELLRRPPDLVHVTSVAPLLCPRPSVFTVHDLAYRLMPEIYPPAVRRRLDWLISLGIRRARRVIAVSEATKRDLLMHYAIPESRVVVIPEAASPALAVPLSPGRAAEILARWQLPARYLLYVGRLHIRKNLGRLIEAYAGLPPALRRDCPLVLVGRRLFDSGPVEATIARCGVADDVVLTGHVDEEALRALYAGATAFVYPSLFEGFGLPPLEAMSLGLPVLTADRHALREVVGDAGLLVDPTDIGALRDGMAQLASDGGLRQRLAALGLARARQFSWARTARETAEVYEDAA